METGIKIAYVVLAHMDPAHIMRLTKKLIQNNENEVFIHVDKKTDITHFLSLSHLSPRVHLLENRREIYWGAFSSVEATLDCFRFAIQYGVFDRFVILQGLDYPIQSNAEISHFFAQHKNVEFIRGINESVSNNIKDLKKYTYYWCMDHQKNPFKLLINKINHFLIGKKVILPFRKAYLNIDRQKMCIYRGYAHFALTQKAVQYVLDFHDTHPNFNQYFKHVYASDESYFHTILFNSPLIDHTPEKAPATNYTMKALLNVTYFEYPDTVVLFKTKADYDRIPAHDYLFFRKASSESVELLDYIDYLHEQQSENSSS